MVIIAEPRIPLDVLTSWSMMLTGIALMCSGSAINRKIKSGKCSEKEGHFWLLLYRVMGGIGVLFGLVHLTAR